MIRGTIRGLFESRVNIEDMMLPWNRQEKKQLFNKADSIEEQAKVAIKHLDDMELMFGKMSTEMKERAIKRINEKCQRLQSENLEQ